MPTHPHPDEGTSKGRTRLILVLFCLMAFSFMDRQMIPALLEPMKRDLAFSDAQMGLIQSVFMVCIALFAAPVSLLVDRWSRRKCTGIMAILWSAMAVLTGVFSNFTLLLGARGLSGCAQSAYKPAAIAWIATMMPAECRSRYVGILNMALPLGAALGTMGAGILAQVTGDWRLAFYFMPLPGIALGMCCFFLPDYHTARSGEATSRSPLQDWIYLLRKKTFVFASLASAAFTFGGFALLGWTPALYSRQYGLSEAEAGILIGVFLVVSALGSIGGGWLSDWFHKKSPRGRAVASLVAACGMFAMRGTYLVALYYQVPLPVAITLGILDCIIGYSWIPTNDVLLQDPVPPYLRASAFGLAYLLIYLLGAAWGPSIVGLISDSYGGGVDGVLHGFMLTMPVVCLCPVFQAIIVKTYIKDIADVNETSASQQ